MKNSWRIARIMGIDIRIDASWVIVFVFFTLSFILEFGLTQVPRGFRSRSALPDINVTAIILGILASLLLFASVLVHELAHAWMAIKHGIPVVSITLFIFGGVAQIADEPDQPATEFWIAIMGPLMSSALAAVFGVFWIWLRVVNAANFFSVSFAPEILLFGILAQINLSLAIFNLAPGFPLDGGRVFRAALWSKWRDVRRATLWASRAGQGIAGVFIAVGAWMIWREGYWSGIWLGLIALFLWNAAREGYRQVRLRETLKNIRVEQLMLNDVKTIAPDLSLADFVGHYLAHYRDPAFAVGDETGLRGLVSSHHVRRFLRAEWQSRRVADAMTPIAQFATLAPTDSAATALQRLRRSNEPEFPVMDSGHLVGVLGEIEIFHFLQLQS